MNPPRYKRPVSVLVVIHTPALDILLLERAAHPGYWQSVTGSQDELADGSLESLATTARREVLEETGIDVSLLPPGALRDWQQSVTWEIFPQWRHRYAPDITHNTEHIFSLCVPAGTPVTLAPREHRDQRWLPWQQAAQEVFSWSNRDAITALATQLAPQLAAPPQPGHGEP